MTGDTALVRRLAYTTALRLAFLTLFLGATAFFYLGGELSSYPFSLRVVFGAIGSAYALAGAYAVALRARKHLLPLAHVQVVLDQITWTAIVYVSGGATSGATSFYALTCLLGAILIGARGAIVGAATGLLLYGGMCAGFSLGVLHPPPDQAAVRYAVSASALAYPLLLNGLGIVAVAALSGYLADRLRLTGGELVLANVRANRAEKLAELGRISSWLAHEIRNPLGSIQGSIEMLKESQALSAEDKQLCAIVQSETARLNELVGDMLDLARAPAPDPAEVDVAALAREVVALAERAPGSKVTVTYEGPTERLVAWCDAAQIRQVVWNLVRNAVQASPDGSSVTVRVGPKDHGVELRVDDAGPGISPELQKRIFEAFYTTRSHGAGIGLAVVKRIIDDHAPYGAEIAVESAPGGGASFRVFLRSAPASTK